MQYMLVDTAVTVFVSEGPLTVANGSSADTGVTFDDAGLVLMWNFTTVAGVITQTAVTPTDTGGVYDWTNVGGGMYKIEIPASGGGTINNDAVGYGFFSGDASGIDPFRGPTYCFAPANVVNSMAIGTDALDVNTVQVGGTTQTAGDLQSLITTVDTVVDTLTTNLATVDTVVDSILSALTTTHAEVTSLPAASASALDKLEFIYSVIAYEGTFDRSSATGVEVYKTSAGAQLGTRNVTDASSVTTKGAVT